MSNSAKNHLWKVIGKQSLNKQSSSQHCVNLYEQQKLHEIQQLNLVQLLYHKSNKNNRPPPLMVNNNLAQKYSVAEKKITFINKFTSKEIQNHMQNDHLLTVSNKSQNQHKHSFHKTASVGEIQEPGSPWINDHGDKISHIKKKSDKQDQLSFSMQKANELIKPQTNSSFVQNKNKLLPIESSKMNFQKFKQPENFTKSAPFSIKVKVNQQQIPSSNEHIKRKSYEQEKWIQDIIENRNNNIMEEVYQLRKANALQRIQFEAKQQWFQKQIRQLTSKVYHKNGTISKLNIIIRNVVQKMAHVKKLAQQQARIIPQQLKQFKSNQIIYFQQQIYDRIINYQYNTKQFSQKCLQQEYQKRKATQKQHQQQKRHIIQQQRMISNHQQQKSRHQKQIRELNYLVASTQSQLQQVRTRLKHLLEEKSQLKIQVQTLEERNKSLKENVTNVNKNVWNRSSKEGEEYEEMVRKNHKLKKQLYNKDNQVNSLKINMQKLKQQQQDHFQSFHLQSRQLQAKISQYKQKFYHQINSLNQQLTQQQSSHQQTKQSLQKIQLNYKERQLQHYKQVEKYDQTLRQVQKDLQILALKKNLKQQDMNQKEIQLNKKENQLLQKYDILRLQHNQYECAIQLYKKNILLLQRKQDLLNTKYHEVLESQTNTKAAWYQRYYQLYSPSHLSNAHSREKNHNSTSNKFNLNLKSAKSQHSRINSHRTPFVQPPILNDIKKTVIKERLNEIDNLRSQNKFKQQSPRTLPISNEVLSRPQSPRVVNLVHKAKSIETQRHSTKSPWRQRPQRDDHTRNNPLISLTIARSSSPKPLRLQMNKEFSVVKAKLDQIKSSIHNEINASNRN